MSVGSETTEDLERAFGAQVRSLRLALDLDQATVARRANVSLGAVQGLEAGRGSTLRTIVRIARALDRVDWVTDFYPEPDVSPLALARAQAGIRTPVRASRRRTPEED